MGGKVKDKGEKKGPHVFGIRHLSPAGAYYVRRFLDEISPELVLIEGPSDFTELIGDLKDVLAAINEKLEPQNHSDWMKRIQDLKSTYPLKYDREGLSCPYVMEEIDRITKGEAIITTDVGQHQMWAAQYYHYTSPRTFLSSGGLGTMGYGLGACIGAQVGQPDKICINIAGDGCFRMNMNELATASRYNIPIIQVVINNHVLGMVRQWQTLFYGKRYSQTVLNDKVDFCKVASQIIPTF